MEDMEIKLWKIWIFIYIVLQSVSLLICTDSPKEHGDLSYGFGNSYNWYSLDGGLIAAKEYDKPIMLIIHKMDCGACKALKSKFSESEAVLKSSENFIFVNLLEEESKNFAGEYSLDGSYYPRIFFLNPDGNVNPDIYNKNGNPEYKYFYHSIDDLLQSMKRAISITSYTVSEEL